MTKLVGILFRCLVAVFWLVAPPVLASYPQGDLDGSFGRDMLAGGGASQGSFVVFGGDLQEPNSLTIETDLPWSDGYYRSYSSSIALYGTADPDNILGTLHLTDLEDGHTYHVDVIGKNSAGLWQGQRFRDTEFITPGNPEGNSSASWTVVIAEL